jgi:hypothetical protein
MDASDLNSKEGFGLAYKLSLLVILAIVAFYLIEEHRAHLIAYSGTIFFIVFVLLHLLMHRGHGGHSGGCSGHSGNDEADHEQDKGGKKCETDKAGEPQDARRHDHSRKEEKL